MRRRNHLGQHLKAVIDGRLLCEDVEAGSANLTGFDRVRKCRFINQIAARGVDDSDALLYRCNRVALTNCLVCGVDGMCRDI